MLTGKFGCPVGPWPGDEIIVFARPRRTRRRQCESLVRISEQLVVAPFDELLELQELELQPVRVLVAPHGELFGNRLQALMQSAVIRVEQLRGLAEYLDSGLAC
ncbi:MAG: hypothetical protein AAF658_17670 [Myxococcota bacterium]